MVYGFDAIIDQKRSVARLTDFIKTKTVPHALLFTGTEGVGKLMCARIFAMTLNCHGNHFFKGAESNVPALQPDGPEGTDLQNPVNACGQCKSCMKILSDNHPDIIQIKSSGGKIKISQIRELIDVVTLKPFEAKIRVVIIDDAHKMNAESANALLKILEEPPDRTIFILIAFQINDLLPTIVSRCQHVGFNPIADEHIAGLLIDRCKMEAKPAQIIATLSNGSISRALSMAKAGWVEKRNWVIEMVEQLSRKTIRRGLSLAERLSKDKARDKANVLTMLEIIKLWLRDLVVYRYDPDRILNKDLFEKISQTSIKYDINQLLGNIDNIQQAEKDIQSNINLRLTLEVLMNRLSSITL